MFPEKTGFYDVFVEQTHRKAFVLEKPPMWPTYMCLSCSICMEQGGPGRGGWGSNVFENGSRRLHRLPYVQFRDQKVAFVERMHDRGQAS